jgi:hypothetical protein
LNEIEIQKQRRIDFEKTFGPFSLWALLPFKKLTKFWSILVKEPSSWPPVLSTFDRVIQKNIEYLMKYIQGLYPV